MMRTYQLTRNQISRLKMLTLIVREKSTSQLYKHHPLVPERSNLKEPLALTRKDNCTFPLIRIILVNGAKSDPSGLITVCHSLVAKPHNDMPTLMNCWSKLYAQIHYILAHERPYVLVQDAGFRKRNLHGAAHPHNSSTKANEPT